MVVIANLDSFDDWPAFSAPGDVAESLLLDRGDYGLARGTRYLLTVLPEHILITCKFSPAPMPLLLRKAAS